MVFFPPELVVLGRLGLIVVSVFLKIIIFLMICRAIGLKRSHPFLILGPTLFEIQEAHRSKGVSFLSLAHS